LISPIDSSLVAVPVTFVWTDTSDIRADTYEIEVSESENFTSLVWKRVGVPETTVSAPIDSLDAGQTYYWRLFGRNNTGLSGPSGVESFVTACQLPGQPIQLEPAHGKVGVDTPTSISWKAAEFAESYRVSLNSDRVSLSASDDTSNTDIKTSGTSVQIDTKDGTTYYWKVVGINCDGNRGDWSQIWSFATTEFSLEFPDKPIIGKNFPNPFNPSTNIRFGVPETQHVLIVVYDALGRYVATLVDGTVDAGYHTITWRATNAPSGVYFYQMVSEQSLETQRMLLLK
jgi:hypothetical protein